MVPHSVAFFADEWTSRSRRYVSGRSASFRSDSSFLPKRTSQQHDPRQQDQRSAVDSRHEAAHVNRRHNMAERIADSCQNCHRNGQPSHPFQPVECERSERQPHCQSAHKTADKLLERKDRQGQMRYEAAKEGHVRVINRKEVVARFVQNVKRKRIAEPEPVDSEPLVAVAKVHGSSGEPVRTTLPLYHPGSGPSSV